MTEAITIRHSTQADRSRLMRLAALDSSDAPEGDALVAELCGELVAAVDEHDGRVVADPFVPTADVVALLRHAAGTDRRPSLVRRLLAS